MAGVAYLEARTEARGFSGFRLRWRWRQLQRDRDQLDHAGVAALRAFGDEIEDRGLQVPEAGR